MDFSEKKVKLTAEIDMMRNKVTELIRRREALLVEEAVRYTEASHPSAADQIAQALIAVHTEHNVKLETLFGIQSAEVNTAGLLLMAEYRDPETIEMFLNNGADVIAKDARGFSVLEMVLQGHDYHWRSPDKWNKAVFDVLAKYVNLDYQEVKGWILEDRCKEAPQYVRDFLGIDDDA
jgi:hypothetical protein